MIVNSSSRTANLIILSVATNCSAQSPVVQSIRRLAISLDNSTVFIFSALLFSHGSERRQQNQLDQSLHGAMRPFLFCNRETSNK